MNKSTKKVKRTSREGFVPSSLMKSSQFMSEFSTFRSEAKHKSLPKMEELNSSSIPIVEAKTDSMPTTLHEQTVLQDDNLWKHYDTSRLSQSEMGKNFISELKHIQKMRKRHLFLGPKKALQSRN